MNNTMNARFETGELGGVRFVNISPEASNARTVSLQLLDRESRDLAQRAAVMAYLSSDPNGDVLEAASSTLSITGTGDGVVVPLSANNTLGNTALMLVSEADGDINVTITQTSGADTIYLVVILPNGELAVSPAIVFV